VLLSLGVHSAGLPLHMGVRAGHTSDSPAPPGASAEGLALGLDRVRGLVADSKAHCQRPLGLGLEKRVGLLTLVPCTWAVRQALEVWGQQHGALPLLREKPGRTRRESPRQWHRQSVMRHGAVEYPAGRQDVAALRCLVGHASQ
jgi:hypothetical protein